MDPYPRPPLTGADAAILGEVLRALGSDSETSSFNAEGLLAAAPTMQESLFQQPPLGPIPEHLRLDLSWHACVAEYEDQIEALERWQAEQFQAWLREHAGSRFQQPEGTIWELEIATPQPDSTVNFRVRAWLRQP